MSSDLGGVRFPDWWVENWSATLNCWLSLGAGFGLDGLEYSEVEVVEFGSTETEGGFYPRLLLRGIWDLEPPSLSDRSPRNLGTGPTHHEDSGRHHR
jgi:hypothetical protein